MSQVQRLLVPEMDRKWNCIFGEIQNLAAYRLCQHFVCPIQFQATFINLKISCKNLDFYPELENRKMWPSWDHASPHGTVKGVVLSLNRKHSLKLHHYHSLLFFQHWDQISCYLQISLHRCFLVVKSCFAFLVFFFFFRIHVKSQVVKIKIDQVNLL